MPPRSRGIAAASLAFVFGLAPSQMQAASETDIHAMLSGSVDIIYGGTSYTAELREQGLKVGDVTRNSQYTLAKIRFGVVPGVETFLNIPVQLSGGWHYSDVATMGQCGAESVQSDTCVLGISDGTTIFLSRDESSAPAWVPGDPVPESELADFDISGLADMELGFRFSPLSEKHLSRNPEKAGALDPKASWIIDLALTVPLGDNFYEVSSGHSGASNGAIGYRFGTAVSKRTGDAEPYVTFSYLRRSPFDAYASTSATEPVEVDPQDDLKVFTGVELIPYEDEGTGTQFSVDIGVGYHLKTAGVWTSGTLLPSVLEEGDGATLDEAVVIDEQPGALGRIRFNFQAFGHLKIHLGTSVGYYWPTRVEHAYNVNYGRALGVTYQFGVAGTF